MPEKNWPNPDLPGVPIFPERDGWHWIHTGNGSGPRPFYWCSKAQGYFTSTEVWAHRWKYTKVWEYHGPVLIPTQINEMLAAERERCADACRAMSFDNHYTKTQRDALEEAENAIRNLGAAP